MMRLGVLGGGQLGRMLLQKAADYPLHVHVLDPDPEAPCRPLCSHFVCGDFRDAPTVEAFAKGCDTLTIEIENVSLPALQRLHEKGLRIIPEPEALEHITDKGLQKQLYQRLGLPTAPFVLAETATEARKAAEEGFVFQKLRRSGYDGYGVRDLSQEPTPLEGPSVMEQKIRRAAELAVMAARDAHGRVVTYPAVEMVFHPQVHRLQYQICPCGLDPQVEQQARQMAAALIESLRITGILAVEFILDQEGRLWVNECAPRPHNSGHHTIEAFDISQFDMLLRIALGLPIREPLMRSPSAMVNILGAPQASGIPDYESFLLMVTREQVFVHVYGKARVKPLRKMGHITLLHPDSHILRKKAAEWSEKAYIQALPDN
ncbi:MAG: ATP-grasp domain-containing protein [Flavobacteriales bacterium]|nr:ATP-grasp domain-containing protein [Flavobacteriales bacterium]